MAAIVDEVLPDPTKQVKIGSFNYQSELVQNGLTSSGECYINRDTTGSDEPPVGLDEISVDVIVHDGRKCDPATLDLNGFTLAHHAYDHIDYYDEIQIVTRYYEEVCSFIKEQTGMIFSIITHKIDISGNSQIY